MRTFGAGPVRVLDLGCGGGFLANHLAAHGHEVTGLDTIAANLAVARARDATGRVRYVQGDALALPFADEEFDRVVAAEVLEHIPADTAAIDELVRVLRPGGTIAVSVPRWLPERICWALSDAYHANEGGHVRIYTGEELVGKLRAAGLAYDGRDHVHGLHAPYWWVKCAVGVDNDRNPLVRAIHRVLVWDIVKKPLATRLAEKALNPLIGKSMVLYLEKPGG